MAEHLSLKWGTLKSWDFSGNEAAAKLMQEYFEIGSSVGAMQQRDTPRQKEIICELIDAVKCEQIYLDWDGRYVSKDDAKKYVRDYAVT